MFWKYTFPKHIVLSILTEKMENAVQLAFKSLAIENTFSEDTGFEKLKEHLIAEINHLFNTDFNRLLNMLYRLDISEERLKLALFSKTESQPIARLITDLIIERQLQKIASKKQYKA